VIGEAGSGSEALALCEEQHPDMIGDLPPDATTELGMRRRRYAGALGQGLRQSNKNQPTLRRP